ncbi:MAG: exodeoxyribonuclease V subunit gamma [Microthrixaceae bacterium]
MSEKPEGLLDELSADLSNPSGDPFTPEWMSVPSLGMANWAKKQLSLRLGARHGRDGIVANVEFASSTSLRRRLIRSYRESVDGPEIADSWRTEELTWSIMEVLEKSGGMVDPALVGVGGVSPNVARAASIARLFDHYNLKRPEMILNWVRGVDVDPEGQQLETSTLWQPRLLRMVKDHVASTRGVQQTPAEAFRDALLQLRSGVYLAGAGPDCLPSRLFVFAQSTLTGDMGPLLQSLAVSRNVKVLLLTPSSKMTRTAARAVAESPVGQIWGADAPTDGRSGDGASTWSFPRSEAPALLSGHPLSQTWGQLQLDAARLLGVGAIIPEDRGTTSFATGSPRGAASFGGAGSLGGATSLGGTSSPASTDANTLLHLVQRGITADQPGEFVGRIVEHDNSIRIHAASGATRQVESLRDQILELLVQDPSLNEDEIVILCPRLDLYAPIITAVFGPSAARDSEPEPERVPNLRYTLVDQNVGTLNPLSGALAELLDLVSSRFTFSQMASLLRARAVQDRFELVDEDLRILSSLGKEARVRWGLDGEHRAGWKVDPSYGANSWSWGIDQLLMGVALGDDLRLAPLPGDDNPPIATSDALAVGGIPPLSLGEGAIAAAGRIAAAVAAIQQVQQLLGDGQNHTIDEWCQKVGVAADLMLRPERFMEWQRSSLDRTLESLVLASVDASGSPSQLKIAFDDFRQLISPAIEGHRPRANLAHGAILVSRPGVLAGVPYKVVCILGLDADALPTSSESSDDLGAGTQWVGDHDPRLRARADLLNVVMSARSHLVITCTGSDVRNNQPVPPAVVLEEFIETVASAIDLTPKMVREGAHGIFVSHPRQAYHPQNFQVRGGRPRPFSYDPIAFEGALALQVEVQRQPVAHRILLERQLAVSSRESDLIDLAELLSFFAHPVRKFFNTTLGVTLPDREDAHDEELPTAISNLDIHAIGQALLTAGLLAEELEEGATDDSASADITGSQLWKLLDYQRAAGVLPPPAIAERELPAISDEVRSLLDLAEHWDVRRAVSAAHSIDLILPSGARLVGNVDGCADGAHPGPVDIRFTRSKPFHRIRQAIQLLALTASSPHINWRGVVITRGAKSGSRPFQSVGTVLGHDPEIRREAALDALDVLVGQYRDGLSCALPLFERTSMAKFTGASIASAWGSATGAYARGEALDRYHRRAFGSLQPSDLGEVSIDGFTLDSEAKRLWGTIDGVIVDPAEDGQKS